MQEIANWQIMGAEELGEPYAACGSEEKARAIVSGGDPNTVYSNEERTCFENIGWPPVAGKVAFWTLTSGPEGSPTGFAVHGIIENNGGAEELPALIHPTP